MSGSVRRVVTGHTPEGRATIVGDERFTPIPIPSGDADFALLWTSDVLPADNDDDTDGRERPAGLTLHGGSVIRVVDLLPGCVSPMHRTNSLDYGIVLTGTVELELDDGEATLLGPGDVVIQRGTMHAWRNPDLQQTARIIFVLTEATARTVDGSPLPELQP